MPERAHKTLTLSRAGERAELNCVRLGVDGKLIRARASPRGACVHTRSCLLYPPWEVCRGGPVFWRERENDFCWLRPFAVIPLVYLSPPAFRLRISLLPSFLNLTLLFSFLPAF